MTNLSEYIQENFGANASYVEGFYDRFKSDPSLVDESWRNYFNELCKRRCAAGNIRAMVKAVRRRQTANCKS